MIEVLKLLLIKIQESDYPIDCNVKWVDLEEMLQETIEEVEMNQSQPETN